LCLGMVSYSHRSAQNIICSAPEMGNGIWWDYFSYV